MCYAVNSIVSEEKFKLRAEHKELRIYLIFTKRIHVFGRIEYVAYLLCTDR